MKVRIATRQSPLALWQADFVAQAIENVDSAVEVEIVRVTTKVERDLSIPISSFAGKGAFTKEVQYRVLEGEADIAVHSAKDMQVRSCEGLHIAAFPVRGTVEDALVGSTLDQLPEGATVATGSARRKVLLSEMRSDLNIVELRGNIDKRLAKLNEVDAIIMAQCALERLACFEEVFETLDRQSFVPQVGQGALAVEARVDDVELNGLLSEIDVASVRTTVEAERSFLAALGGDCDLPAGAHATETDARVTLSGFLAEDGKIVRAAVEGEAADNLGAKLAAELTDALKG